MMDNVIRHILLLLALVMVGPLALSSDCASSTREGFAIYLTAADTPPAAMPPLAQVELGAQPLIRMNDIITYNTQTHELKLSASAYEAIAKLNVPVRGKSFVVCVDKKPVYWGAFWTPISSISFDGITIWKPLSVKEPHIVTIEQGYPSPEAYVGVDPRNDPQILDTLKRAGKLTAGLSIETVEALPDSMKGYELYSWNVDGQWHFTLMTGTDRNKTLDEIVSGEDYISEAGWVRIEAVGTGAIEMVLGKLSPGESVLWLAGLRAPTGPAEVSLSLPDASMVEALKAYAASRGLDLGVAS